MRRKTRNQATLGYTEFKASSDGDPVSETVKYGARENSQLRKPPGLPEAGVEVPALSLVSPVEDLTSSSGLLGPLHTFTLTVHKHKRDGSVT